LGVARWTDLGIEQSVEPCLVEANTPLAAVDGSLNAVYTESDYAHETLLVGRGAGGDPTASAVVADIMDIARNVYVPAFGVEPDQWRDIQLADMDKAEKAVYIRLIVEDRSGVLADIAKILSEAGISIQSALQLSEITKGIVPLILTTHTSQAKVLNQAIEKIGKLKPVKEPPFTMRIIEQE
jgi:homoserine dehydrogenase